MRAGLRAFGAGLAACSAAAVVAQAQAVAVQQAQQQGSGLAAGLAALGYGGSPLGALGSPAQLQNTGISSLRRVDFTLLFLLLSPLILPFSFFSVPGATFLNILYRFFFTLLQRLQEPVSSRSNYNLGLYRMIYIEFVHMYKICKKYQ